jgi:hypothetical protein
MIRQIAKKIHPGRRASQMTFEDFPNFIKYNIPRQNQSIELVLDEIDEILHIEADTGYPGLKALRKAGEIGRIIFGGRRMALRAGTDGNMPLRGRLTTLRLSSLDSRTARDLLLLPLDELGIVFRNEDKIVNHILNMTGCIPNLIQWYGNNIAIKVIQENRRFISIEDVQFLENQFETRTYFTDVFEDIREPEVRLVALILTKAHIHKASLGKISSHIEKEKVILNGFLGQKTLNETCEDLVIHNVLRWDGDSYSLANSALHHFASQAGYIEALTKDTRLALASS